MNCVTPVKHQGNCGSCWAFAAIGVLESNILIKNGCRNKTVNASSVDLSEQQLVSCVPYGCNGGDSYNALNYLRTNFSISESSYPYSATNGTCKTNFSSGIKSDNVTMYYNKTINFTANELYNRGPFVTYVYVTNGFYYYTKGTIYIPSDTECPINQVNHAVIVVGYGSQNGIDYWILTHKFFSNYFSQYQ